MAIENAPFISQEDLLSAMLMTPNDKVQEMVNKINETFEYWDTVKYKSCPKGCTPQLLWTYVKVARTKSMMSVWGKYGISLTLTNQMQRICHEIDMNWGGSCGADSIIGKESSAPRILLYAVRYGDARRETIGGRILPAPTIVVAVFVIGEE